VLTDGDRISLGPPGSKSSCKLVVRIPQGAAPPDEELVLVKPESGLQAMPPFEAPSASNLPQPTVALTREQIAALNAAAQAATPSSVPPTPSVPPVPPVPSAVPQAAPTAPPTPAAPTEARPPAQASEEEPRRATKPDYVTEPPSIAPQRPESAPAPRSAPPRQQARRGQARPARPEAYTSPRGGRASRRRQSLCRGPPLPAQRPVVSPRRRRAAGADHQPVGHRL
jgi:hypothetical protein